LTVAPDGTGTRITTAGCGLNGQMTGAALDEQTVTLTQANLPNVAPTFAGNTGEASSRHQARFQASMATLHRRA
jgi:hypothetical protein